MPCFSTELRFALAARLPPAPERTDAGGRLPVSPSSLVPNAVDPPTDNGFGRPGSPSASYALQTMGCLAKLCSLLSDYAPESGFMGVGDTQVVEELGRNIFESVVKRAFRKRPPLRIRSLVSRLRRSKARGHPETTYAGSLHLRRSVSPCFPSGIGRHRPPRNRIPPTRTPEFLHRARCGRRTRSLPGRSRGVSLEHGVGRVRWTLARAGDSQHGSPGRRGGSWRHVAVPAICICATFRLLGRVSVSFILDSRFLGWASGSG